MQNELKLKKFFLFSLIISAIFLLVFIFLNIYEYQTITKNYNYQIAALITNLKNHEPQLSETEIIKILNSNSKANLELFNKYGIFLTKASTVLANKKLSTTYLFLNITFFLILIIIFITMLILYSKKTSKEIKDLTKYLEEINKKNYDLKIALNTEDELSILKNEIYKTTIMLKEIAEINQNEKLNLKKSLEDISHQLKTPLTSILIMLDNILDEENMPNQTKNEFLRDIKSQILNINFLVEALLKLAKFDAILLNLLKKKRLCKL